MCCWYQLPSVLSCCAGRSWGRSPSGHPATRQHMRELMSTTQTYPWIILIIAWCRQFLWLSANILLIKSKLKLELRATVFRSAMSPCNLGGKYQCCPHPWRRKCMCHFFAGSRVCQSNRTRAASSLGYNFFNHVVCLKTVFLWHTAQWKWRVLHIRFISVLEQVGMSFNGIAYLMRKFSFCSSGSFQVSGDGTHRSCANFKCEVADVKNGILIDFRAIKCVSVESGQPYHDNISWYIQFN